MNERPGSQAERSRAAKLQARTLPGRSGRTVEDPATKQLEEMRTALRGRRSWASVRAGR